MSDISTMLVELAEIKDDIKNAITSKGQTVGDNFREYAEAIEKISGGGGDEPVFTDEDPLTFVRVEDAVNGYVSLEKVGAPSSKSFEYNKNGEGWQTYTEGTKIHLNKYEYVQFRSNDTTAVSSSTSNYRNFKFFGFYKCFGNIMSLMNNTTTLSGKNYCFYYLFIDCSTILKAPVLPATTLANYCYNYMFQGCTSLVNAPALPATTLASNCYRSMFSGCTSLVNVPALPATTLASNCYYYMFYNCTSLVNAPALPATRLASYCYSSMFQGCTSLVNAPALPATTLANYCYYYMFYDCIKLKEIYCNARYKSDGTEITSTIDTSWLQNVPNTTDCIFHKNPEWSGPTSRGNNTIPSNWQIVDWRDNLGDGDDADL